MNLSTHSYRSSLALTMTAAALALGAAACAAQPVPPPVAAAPPAQAFQQASSGAAEQQGPEDGIVFVDQEHKDPVTHDDAAPATSLQAGSQTARPKR